MLLTTLQAEEAPTIRSGPAPNSDGADGGHAERGPGIRI